VEITRERLSPPEVSGRMQGAGIGYVRVPGFTAASVEQMRAKVAELRKQGAARLIVDVRDCAVGDLTDGIAVARLFVGSGTLAIREGRNEPRETVKAVAGDGSITLPAVVLVNAGTSGPAELFAAALEGNKRAEVVGEHTIGRATVQKLVPLPDGTAMLLSNVWYLGPNGEQITEKGLAPNVDVEEPDIDFGTSPPATDPLLLKAIERIGNTTVR
jgi:carboxyl-terminal processing protease